jgi:hypothetical protein
MEDEEVWQQRLIWMLREGTADVTDRTKKLLPKTATILRLSTKLLQVTHRLAHPLSRNAMWNEYVNVLIFGVTNVLARSGIRRV